MIVVNIFIKSPSFKGPLFFRGVIPPFGKGREGGIYLQCLYNYGLISKFESSGTPS